MKTIKELIDFVRKNPKFFPDEFYMQILNRKNIIFDQGKFMVICRTGEVAVNDETDLSKEQIESRIFSSFQETMISKIQQHIETCYLAILEPSLEKIKNNPKSHFTFEDEDILTTKGGVLGIDITNSKALFLPDISPEQKIAALTEFFEKIVLEKRRLNAEKVFETRNHSESEAREAKALEARKTKAQTKYENPKEEKNPHPKDNKDLRIATLKKHAARKLAINTQHTTSI